MSNPIVSDLLSKPLKFPKQLGTLKGESTPVAIYQCGYRFYIVSNDAVVRVFSTGKHWDQLKKRIAFAPHLIFGVADVEKNAADKSQPKEFLVIRDSDGDALTYPCNRSMAYLLWLEFTYDCKIPCSIWSIK